MADTLESLLHGVKPCHLEGDVGGVRRICNRPLGHAPPHLLDLHKLDAAREPSQIPQATMVAWAPIDRFGHTADGRVTVQIRGMAAEVAAVSMADTLESLLDEVGAGLGCTPYLDGGAIDRAEAALSKARAEVESLRRERDAARQVVADHDRIAIAEVESLRAERDQLRRLLDGGESLRNIEAEARIRRLEEALRALVERLDEVHRDPAYVGVWHLHQIHGGPYRGPRYVEQLDAARAALASTSGEAEPNPTKAVANTNALGVPSARKPEPEKEGK